MLADAVHEQSDQLIQEQAARLASADPDFLFAARLRTTAVDKPKEVHRRAKRIPRAGCCRARSRAGPPRSGLQQRGVTRAFENPFL